MQRSASSDHTTTQVRHPTKWEMPGLAKLGICSMGIGVIALAGVIIDGHDSAGVGTLAMSILAVGVTLICGGLETIRWGISAQKGTRREELFAEDLFAIEQGQHTMTDSLTKFVTTETAQADRSREARERLERMERSLIAVDAKLADAEAFGQHLVTLADRMEALEKRQEELLNLMVAWSSSERTQQRQRASRPPAVPGPRRSRRRGGNEEEHLGDNVRRLPTPKAVEALKRIAKRIADDSEE